MTWHFPLPRTHTGILLGNGTLGLMVWGEERLHVTVGRAGFWDHRGGTRFSGNITFRRLRALLEAGDEAGIRAAFSKGRGNLRPRQIGCGRLEIEFVGGARPVRGELETSAGRLVVHLDNGRTAVLRMAMDEELAWIDCDCIAAVRARPAWDFIGEELAAMGCAPPEVWAGGFRQSLPEDEALALAWEKKGSRLVLATALGGEPRLGDVEAAAEPADEWWRNYTASVPVVRLPDPVLQEAWDYGVYKQAGLSTPGAPAATLQGPWMEEYQLPPWSNDYHFNINLQMVYWPCLSTNRLEHFAPLWEMIAGWLPHLRENAERFFEVKEALMLPHAVDDRCAVVGTFWTGTIDHACTAWVAHMAWLHYRYSMDAAVLREVAWPLLTGAFNGYWAMLEEHAGRLSLPVSVSPEFGGSGMEAWGRDASFQLAACHFLARTLPRAAEALGVAVDPRWEEMRERLPGWTVSDPARGIALWEGRDFDVSHRHHSHLAGVYPFCTIDPAGPEAELVRRSIENWTRLGAGNWTGWCLPWAGILCARCGLADAAVAWLHWWAQVFCNVGRGTLHDRAFPGVGGLGPQAVSDDHPEVMQIEAGMGAVTAISELLVQCRGDVIAVLPRVPSRWQELEFDGVRTEGAFLVGATVRGERVVEVRVRSLAGGVLQLAHGMGADVSANGEPVAGAILSTEMTAGQTLTLGRSGGGA